MYATRREWGDGEKNAKVIQPARESERSAWQRQQERDGVLIEGTWKFGVRGMDHAAAAAMFKRKQFRVETKL